MQTDFTKTEEGDRLHKNRRGGKTAFTEIGRKTVLTKTGREDRLNKNRRGGETALTETEEIEEETGVWERNIISRL